MCQLLLIALIAVLIGIAVGLSWNKRKKLKDWIGKNADWLNALSTAFLAVFTVVLALGTIGLYLATKNLVEGTDDTAKRQLRAYVGVGANDFSFELPDETDPAYKPVDLNAPPQILKDFLVINVKNFGQTPAHDVVVFGNVTPTLGASDLPQDFFSKMGSPDKIDASTGIFVSTLMLQPQQTATSKHVILDVRPFTAAKSRNVTIFVWGQIYYKDIYERTWRTRFCYSWEPWHPPGARFVPYKTHNDEDQTMLGG